MATIVFKVNEKNEKEKIIEIEKLKKRIKKRK